ncbi:MAG: thiamine-phosphate kinase [Pseudanabaenaceae cyanobacterium]
MRLSDLGEWELLARLRPYCSDRTGDDGAVLPMRPGHRLVVSTDMLVDGVHFSDRTTSPVDVGWRAAAANLSDLAAMGATPLGAVVALAAPPTTEWAWVEGVYQGLQAGLQAYGATLDGGDTVRAPGRSLTVTVLGEVLPDRIWRRSAAQPGQVLWVSGPHGRSRAGLALLQGEIQVPEPLATEWRLAHQRPRPRLDVVRAMPPGPWAAIDSSDGLAIALLQLCQSSGVGARLDWTALPLLSAPVDDERARDWGLYGGEDFELVMALPPAIAADLCGRFPESRVVGTVVAAPGIPGLDTHPAFHHF